MLKQGDILEDKLQVERLLSQGGYGRVWEAKDLILKMSVAIKELINLTEE